MTDDLHTRIRDLADELTDPRVHREPYTIWTGQRHRQIRHHATVQHGLLRQLYTAAIIPTVAATDEGGGSRRVGAHGAVLINLIPLEN